MKKRISSPVQILMLAVCCEPKLAVKFGIFNAIYIIGALIVFSYALYKAFTFKVSITPLFAAIILYRLSFGVQTIYAENNDLLTWGYMSIVLLALCLLFEYYSTVNFERFLNSLADMLLLYMIINSLIVLLSPGGLIDGIYFIGIRTRFTDPIFVMIAISMICDWMQCRNIGTRTALAIAISLFNIVMVWIGTALVGLGVAVIVYMLLSNMTRTRTLCSPFGLTIISLIITYFVVFRQIQTDFSWLISGVLGKNSTLTGRSDIWSIAIPIIAQKPLLGHGMAANGNFVPYKYTLWQAHNQWLQLAYDGGLFTVICFCLMMLFISLAVKPYFHTRAYKILIACFGAYSIMMTSEIYTYMIYIFLLLLTMYHIREITIIHNNNNYKFRCYEQPIK
ncbi:O-antigen polymerase family protein [Bifidobacterium saguini DSM 23967]|uniref:O-antigen polymerase family protein n=2 Tax=Bifidobacterium saguini TaxID=762210 RepID=A0A087D7W9_9BIFI|nr:O-antigen ligase family protein [Bifidobacterium saguini]KFI91619.1 O-antigen polymerase family protein [Bifidobacterium saguini DSM 23967]QTB90243.1 O-antigen ligase family protein [Bifidobacterium saguini]